MQQDNIFNHNFSEEDLSSYIISRGKRFTNARGMVLGITDDGEVWTEINMPIPENDFLKIDIITGPEYLLQLVHWFDLQSPEDMDQLDHNHSWSRYLNGTAQVNVTSEELDASFNFQIEKTKTLVSSLELHFYDEVMSRMEQPAQVLEYFRDNEDMLLAVEVNRYKLYGRRR